MLVCLSGLYIYTIICNHTEVHRIRKCRSYVLVGVLTSQDSIHPQNHDTLPLYTIPNGRLGLPHQLAIIEQPLPHHLTMITPLLSVINNLKLDIPCMNDCSIVFTFNHCYITTKSPRHSHSATIQSP